ncbi:phage holin family protein [Turicibacter sanguinis]|uniref:phage holin family protein n=1 Tax=Turicibacter sanguinis TaxID=154288 RepID=UPI0018AAD139|nr:phage holin family protein [Turicibacter sanguinis]MDB8552562.1 phage holin family protein [Turicibacter sanguinis]
MDLSFLQTYCIPVIVGICLCVGYVIKNSLTLVQNKYIPLIMAILGLILNVWINKGISPDIVLRGMFSGLSSTGVHQLFKQLIQVQSDEK